VCVCVCVCVCKLWPRVCLCLTLTGAKEGVLCFCAGHHRACDLYLSKSKSVSQRTEIGFMLCCYNAAFQLLSQQGVNSGWLHPHIFKHGCRRESLPLGRRSSQPFLSGSVKKERLTGAGAEQVQQKGERMCCSWRQFILPATTK
jgi:hypothetical protein